MHSDATLTANGIEIPVHRSVLASRSPYFKAMFDHKMGESIDGMIGIDDIKTTVLMQLLRFLYTGVCSLNETPETKQRAISPGSKSSSSSHSSHSQMDSKDTKEDSEPRQQQQQQRKAGKHAAKEEKEDPEAMAVALLAAADRFQVPQLSELCAKKLMKTLTVDNVADRLILADTCHSAELRKQCLDFMKTDTSRLGEIMDSDGFQKLGQAHLHNVLSAFVPQSSSSRKRSRSEGPGEGLTKDQVKRLKVSELKAELTSRGLDVSGLKKDLVERLENSL
jgi:hypothetical protein